MGGVDKHSPDGIPLDLRPASERDAAVAALDRPWIADEDALTADVRRPDSNDLGLRLRGLAFDAHTTVHWDEDAVRVVSAGDYESREDVVARRSQVLLREAFHTSWSGSRRLERVDYVAVDARQGGALIGSRYVVVEALDA